MTVFDDLTEYTYFSEYSRPRTKNIGWLGETSHFKLTNHRDSVLELVWNACSISIAQTRGFHLCPLCKKFSANNGRRGPQFLLLGTSETRVFSKNDDIYAAPTLIYHYMANHHYSPPNEFLTALVEGLTPPSDDYFSRLRAVGLTWTKTSSSPETQARYRLVKRPDQTMVQIRIDDDE